jgi:two-component system NarL family sensor kinase
MTGLWATLIRVEDLGGRYADSTLMVNALSDKSALLADDKKYTEALVVAQSGLGIAQRNNEKESQATLANAIAICLLEQEKPEEALHYSKMVLEIGKKVNVEEHIVSGYYILGYNYVLLKQYKTAEQYLLTGLEQALATKNIDNIANVYGQLSVVYRELGRYKKALDYKIRYAAIRDSLLGKESASRIAEVETRYRVAQKDKELAQKDKALLQNQLKIASQQKEQYLWIGGASVCILSLLGLLYHKRYRTELTRLKATLEGEEKERSRLARELHDGIVSRLSIIKMNFSALPQQYRNLNEAGDFQDVVDQLEQSITELRTTSHNLLPEILQRTGLLESLKIYCEKIRKIALLDIEFQVIGELPPLVDEFQLNIYRIIQELVNNIIKHSNASHALIQLNAQSEWLNITLDDNGNGAADAAPEQEKGIGLRNLQDRVRMLNGTLEIERGKGTSVYLEFNLKKFIRKV